MTNEKLSFQFVTADQVREEKKVFFKLSQN